MGARVRAGFCALRRICCQADGPPRLPKHTESLAGGTGRPAGGAARGARNRWFRCDNLIQDGFTYQACGSRCKIRVFWPPHGFTDQWAERMCTFHEYLRAVKAGGVHRYDSQHPSRSGCLVRQLPSRSPVTPATWAGCPGPASNARSQAGGSGDAG
jgi:hypothetical protein